MSHLKDYKVRMGKKAKMTCSRDELFDQVAKTPSLPIPSFSLSLMRKSLVVHVERQCLKPCR